jgi:hypothetical protein
LERGVYTLVLSSLATVLSSIDSSVRIVTKSLKVGPLFIFSISLYTPYQPRKRGTDTKEYVWWECMAQGLSAVLLFDFLKVRRIRDKKIGYQKTGAQKDS